HLLSKGISTILIGSTFPYGETVPHGSHPMIDGLFSSMLLDVEHDGAHFNRLEKTLYVARSPEAMEVLRVCTRNLNESEINCSRCQKCLRTMLTLDLAGVTGSKAPTFDWSDYTPDKFGNIFLRSASIRNFAMEVLEAATTLNRQDIVEPIQKALRRSSYFA